MLVLGLGPAGFGTLRGRDPAAGGTAADDAVVEGPNGLVLLLVAPAAPADALGTGLGAVSPLRDDRLRDKDAELANGLVLLLLLELLPAPLADEDGGGGGGAEAAANDVDDVEVERMPANGLVLPPPPADDDDEEDDADWK